MNAWKPMSCAGREWKDIAWNSASSFENDTKRSSPAAIILFKESNPSLIWRSLVDNFWKKDLDGASLNKFNTSPLMTSVFFVWRSLAAESTIESVGTTTLSVLIDDERKKKLKNKKKLKKTKISLRWTHGERLWSMNRARNKTGFKLFKRELQFRAVGLDKVFVTTSKIVATAVISMPNKISAKSGRLWIKNEEKSAFFGFGFRNWAASP